LPSATTKEDIIIGEASAREIIGAENSMPMTEMFVQAERLQILGPQPGTEIKVP